MASSLLLGLTIFIGLLSISVAARPCKTLFISSYSISINPMISKNPNDVSSYASRGYMTVFTEFRQFNPRRASYPSQIFINRRMFPGFVDQPQIQRPQEHSFPLTYDFNSLRDRTKDILSVVMALLFGVGCGALTAATLYLFWSLFANRDVYGSSFSHFEDESEDEYSSPKKMGYVKIPAASPVDSVPVAAKVAA